VVRALRPGCGPEPGIQFPDLWSDPLLFEDVNEIVSSFTPAAGYPGPEAPACDVINSVASHLVQYTEGMQLIIDGDLPAGAVALEPVLAGFEADKAWAATLPAPPVALEAIAALLPVTIDNYVAGTALVAEGAIEEDFDKIQLGEQIHTEGSATLAAFGSDIAGNCNPGGSE
jgi:hypothetical protein